MKRPFFQRHGLLILMIVFFLVPFAVRGARMAIQGMRNEVKDWLPASFEETKELERFRELFYGEAFIAISWEGCTGERGDGRFRTFVDKFIPEVPPSRRAAEPEEDQPVEAENHFYDNELGLYIRDVDKETIQRREDLIGNRLGIYTTGNYHRDWGGQGEVWLRGHNDQWYYLLPNGDLYRWLGTSSPMAALFRWCQESMVGRTLQGEHVASLGVLDGPWYYQNPRRLEADLFKSVVTGPSLLYELTKEGGVIQGETDIASERLQGWLFGPDGKQTCLYITLSNLGREHLHRVIGRGIVGRPRGKLLTMADESGLRAPPRPSLWPPPLDALFAQRRAMSAPLLHLGGPAVDNVAIDEEGQVTLMRLVGLSIGVGLIVSWISFRSVPVVLVLSFIGITAAEASVAFVGWSGSILDAVLMSMPSLVYVLGLSGAVHIVNYYRDTVFREGFPGSPEQALHEGWKPCTLAALTTAIGLISLAASDIVPIRKFGFYSAIGVVFTLTLLFTFLPAVLSMWPPRSFQLQMESKRRRSSNPDFLGPFWEWLSRFVVRRHAPVAIVCLVLMCTLAVGLRHIRTSVQLLKLFDPRNKLIVDYAWLETHLGKLVPMELVIQVPPSVMRLRELEEESGAADEKFRLSFLDRMEIGEHIRKATDEHFGPGRGDVTGTAMLASTFVPPLPELGGGSMQSTYRNTFSRRLAGYRDELLRSEHFRMDEEGNEFWRVSLRLGALNDVDYGKFVVTLKAAVEPVMAAYRVREQILHALQQQAQGEEVRGREVLLLADAVQLKNPETPDEGETLPRLSEPTPDNVNQDIIFVRTLYVLLRNAAISCRVLPVSAETPRDELLKNLRKFDMLAVTSTGPAWEDALQTADLPPQIDVTDFQFDPAQEHQTARAKGWPVSVAYTGLVPVVYKAQRTLLQSLVKSTWGAFVAIMIVMIIVLRSFRAGALAMIPNVFPVVVIFGFMGWRNILVDIGTMMTASIAMGVAVDDTLHFLTWFRRGLDRGLDRAAAIADAYKRCGTAMVQTTLIAGVGLSVFGFSTFTPTQRFGVLMLTLMVAALVGDLVMLPALLAGPLGRVFRQRKTTLLTKPTAPTSDAAASDGRAAASAYLSPHDAFIKNLSRTSNRSLPGTN